MIRLTTSLHRSSTIVEPMSGTVRRRSWELPSRSPKQNLHGTQHHPITDPANQAHSGVRFDVRRNDIREPFALFAHGWLYHASGQWDGLEGV